MYELMLSVVKEVNLTEDDPYSAALQIARKKIEIKKHPWPSTPETHP